MYPVCFISLSILDAEAYFDIYFEDKRDPDALPPKTLTGRLLHKTAPFFRFFKSPQGFLALRSGIVSVAMWVPAVCPQTAWFYYDNKGIWALIMAQVGRVLILSILAFILIFVHFSYQTGLAMYAGNQVRPSQIIAKDKI